ncbi:MAG: hypothetical protein Q4B88_05730 [Moraxella sp.]|nr:hypothetical protein [Moraxella sp.]
MSRLILAVLSKTSLMSVWAMLCAAWLLVGCYQSNGQAKLTQTEDVVHNVQYEASHHHCPRLLQRAMGSELIEYHDHLHFGSCDYYIYPQAGDKLMASVSDPALGVMLVSPVKHEFSEGVFKVEELGRYVVRVYPKKTGEAVTRDYHLKILF